MKLLEYQGKELFKKYEISIPKGELVLKDTKSINLNLPFVLKAQVPSGNRKKTGGIIFVENGEGFEEVKNSLFGKTFAGAKPLSLLAEEKILSIREKKSALLKDKNGKAFGF